MIQEKINIAELLKDCPKGMEFDCLLCNSPIALEGVAGDESTYPIRAVGKDGFHHVFTKHGTSYNHDDAKCVIFPKGKTTWEGFVPPCKFKDGDVVTSVFQGVVQGTGIFDYEEQSEAWIHACINLNNEFFTDVYLGHVYDLRLATEEEKEKLFKAIKDNGYRWNPNNKTLEKLVEPIFSVGNKIEKCGYRFTIAEVKDDYYLTKCGNKIPFDNQDDFSLVPNKFDINTLKPFESRVLMRSSNAREWTGTIFSHYSNNKFYGCGMCCDQCIPYEGNEHLLGTTDDCDEHFKTWNDEKRN